MSDPRDAEIAALRQQVTNLTEAVRELARQRPGAETTQPPHKPPPFFMLEKGPNAGQYVRLPMTDEDSKFIQREGFRWEGTTPIFPPHWPRVDPATGEPVTVI